MTPTESVLSALQRNWEMVDAAFVGIDETLLEQRPNDQCNSIAWLLWHMNRVLDTFIHTNLQDKPLLWISEGWYQKYGMEQYGLEDSRFNRGVGWTAEQVMVWVAPSREVQLGYYAVLKAGTRACLSSATQADLEKPMVFPPVAEPRSTAAVLGQVTWDNIVHGGQIAYLRGFYQGMGWHR